MTPRLIRLFEKFCENSHFNGFSKGLLKQGEFSSHSGSPKIKMNATVGFQADGFPGPYWFLLAKASSSSSSEIQKYWGKISGRYLIYLDGIHWKDFVERLGHNHLYESESVFFVFVFCVCLRLRAD